MAETDIIQQFKTMGAKEPSVLHLLDDAAERLLLVWHAGLCDRKLKLKVTDSPPAVLPAHHLWAWLWFRFEVYYEKWLDLAAMPLSKANLARAKNLIDTRLLYPDGTIHQWVRNTLNAKAVAQYQSLNRTANPPPAPAAAAPATAAVPVVAAAPVGKKG